MSPADWHRQLASGGFLHISVQDSGGYVAQLCKTGINIYTHPTAPYSICRPKVVSLYFAAAPNTSPEMSSPSPTPGEPSPFTNPCSIVAQADLFGMGIRVSLYLQWYTTVLAYLYDPDLATECTVVNYCFSIAVAIASLVHPGDIYAHEVIIIAMMLLVPPMIILVALADNFVSVYRPAKSGKATEPEAVGVAVLGEKVDPNDPGGPVNAGDPDWRAAGTGNPAAPPPPNRPPVKPHGPADWLREIAVVVSTTFLLVVSVWEFFVGVKKAQKANACHALFIYSHYLAGRYERLLKTVSIMSSIFTPLALVFLIYLRTIPGAEATHLVSWTPLDNHRYLSQ